MLYSRDSMWTDAYYGSKSLVTVFPAYYDLGSLLLILHTMIIIYGEHETNAYFKKYLVNTMQSSHFWHNMILVALILILHAISNRFYLNICILAYQSLLAYYFQHTMIEKVSFESCIQLIMESMRLMHNYKINCKYYAIKSLLTYSSLQWY